MSMIIWILLGLGMGLIASKIVSTRARAPSSTLCSASSARSLAAG